MYKLGFGLGDACLPLNVFTYTDGHLQNFFSLFHIHKYLYIFTMRKGIAMVALSNT